MSLLVTCFRTLLNNSTPKDLYRMKLLATCFRTLLNNSTPKAEEIGEKVCAIVLEPC